MSHSPQDLKMLSDLLDRAFGLDEPERARWLDGLEGDAARLAPALRDLLARNATPETVGLLGRPPWIAPSAASAGESVGRYRLLASLGAGGMGEVWLAERADGAIRRKVALKLPHALWVPGLAERFAREREILAALEHPHIARLYDVGLDELGRPYMALEYVEGEPIDAYCREHALGVDARLRLLLQVADAVAFAHSRLVVHRDLKPGNILVTRDGQVRLLDFGIAKLLQDGASARETALTQAAGRALSLDYASPEQIKGEPIGTASDVYSLGVVAYELLAGARPYRLERASAAALEEAIAHADVPRASSQAADPALRKRLRGDHDAILNKALKKDARERYATVDALASDWRSALAGQRVVARPDTLAYRLRRVVRRYRVPLVAAVLALLAFGLAIGFGATALVIGALLAGLAATTWQARRAREQARIAQEQARIAQTEARTAQAVQDFLEGIFRASSGAQADPVRARQRTALELLEEGTARVESELDAAPAAKVRVLKTLAHMYHLLGHYDRVTQLLERRLAVAERLGPDPGATVVVHALADLANQMSRVHRAADALRLLTRADAVAQHAPSIDDDARIPLELAWADYHSRRDDVRVIEAARRAAELLERRPPSEDLVQALLLKGKFERMTGLAADAVRSLRRALAAADRLPGGGGAARVSPLLQLAFAEAASGDHAAAEASMREGLRFAESTVGVASTWSIIMLGNLGQLLAQGGRYRETIDLTRDARERIEQLPESADKAQMMNTTIFCEAPAERSYGNPERALARFDEWDALQRSQPSHPREVATMLAWRAEALTDRGDLVAARDSVDAALRLRAEHELNDYRRMVAVAHADVVLALVEGNIARARDVLQRCSDHPHAANQRYPDLLAATAEVKLAAEGAAAASEAAGAALDELAQPSFGDGAKPARFRLLLVRARALLAQGRLDDARGAALLALDANAAMCDIERSPDRLLSLIALADAQLALGERDAARTAAEQADAIARCHPRLGPQYLEPLKSLQSRLSNDK